MEVVTTDAAGFTCRVACFRIICLEMVNSVQNRGICKKKLAKSEPGGYNAR